MAVTHGTPTRNTIANVVAAIADAGSGAAKLKIRDASNVVLATITLADPSHSAASGGVAALAGLPKSDTDADASGTAANFIVTDSDDATVYGGSCGVGSGDLQLDTLAVVIHYVVTVVSGGYTAPP